VFVPSYVVSRTYITNVNISNTTVNRTVVNNYYENTVINKNVSNVRYVNQGVPNAVTATSPQAFTSAQPVARNMVVVNEREIAAAPALDHAPALVPPKQAVLGAGATTRVQPPAKVQSRAVVAKTAPPPAPAPFAAQQAALQKNQGRPLSIAETRQLQPAQAHTPAAPVRIAPPAKAVAPTITNAHSGSNKDNAAPGPLNPNRPPKSSPGTTVDAQLEQKHQQQLQQLQQKQDQEYQQLQQKHAEEQQKAELEKQQELQQKHQQELQQLQEKHGQKQQALKQQQQAEHTKAYSAPAKSSDDKPKK
jgi:Skp family chaperone for outer membrane proteins